MVVHSWLYNLLAPIISVSLILQIFLPLTFPSPTQNTPTTPTHLQTAVPTLTHPISIARQQSTYDANSTAVITYTVRNNLTPLTTPDIPPNTPITDTLEIISAFDALADPHTLHNVLLTNSFPANVTLLHTGKTADTDGDTYAFNLGDIPPLGTAVLTITLTTPGGISDITPIDNGAQAHGLSNGRTVTASAAPALIMPNDLSQWLTCTLDANCADPYILTQAGQLGSDPTAIFEFVQSISFESYSGSLRGSRGALWSQAGNAADQSSLLIALLRASGIPARYKQGTLDDTQIETLLQTMFPTIPAYTGYIPADYATQTAVPTQSTDLIDETRNHWWVEAYFPGQGWLNLDATYPGTAVGDTIATPTDPTPLLELPDAIRHKITLQVKMEDYNPLNIGDIPGLDYTTPLSVTLTAVELVGEPVTLAHLTTTNNQGGLIFTNLIHHYTPYLTIGQPNGADSSQDIIIEGDTIMELLTNFPFGSNLITAEWLVMTLTAPDGASQTFERTIYDSLGYALRQTGGAGVFDSAARDDKPFVSDLSTYTTLFAPSFIPYNVIDDDYALMAEAAVKGEAALATLDEIMADNDLSTDEEPTLLAAKHDLLQLSRISQRTHLLQYAATSDFGVQRLGSAYLVRPYYTTPRIHTVSWETNTTTGDQTVLFDLRQNQLRALPHPGQTVEAWQSFNVARGIAEMTLESELLQAITPDQPATSVHNILTTAQTQGIPLRMITAANLTDLADLTISDEAKARITTDLTQNPSHFVIVPSQMVTIGNQTTIGWLQSDIITGETIDVGENGLHTVAIEYSIMITGDLQEGAFAIIGFGHGFAAYIFSFLGNILGAVPGDVKAAWGGAMAAAEAQTQAIQDTISENMDHDWVDAYLSGVGVSGGGEASAGPLSVGFGEFEYKVGGFANGVAFASSVVGAADPPLIPALTVQQLPAVHLRPVQGVFTAPATSSGTAVNDTITLDAFSTFGPTTATWSSTTQRGLQFQQLTTQGDLWQNGAPIGSGALSAIAQPITPPWPTLPAQAAVTGSANSSANGLIGFSFFAPALDGLGSGSHWPASATLTHTPTGSANFQLTHAAAAINNGAPTINNLAIQTTNPATISGNGPVAAANFAANTTLTPNNGVLILGPSSDTLTVGSTAVSLTNGAALVNYSGTATLSEANSSSDTLSLNGSGQYFTISLDAPTSSTIPGDPITFQVDVAASFSDAYTTTLTTPTGWPAALNNNSATLTPTLTTAPGDYPVRVTIQSTTHPSAILTAYHTVTVQATEGVEIAITPDPRYTVPVGQPAPTALDPDSTNNGQVQLPNAAYMVQLTNRSTIPHTFNVTLAGLSTNWLLFNGSEGSAATQVSLPAGGVTFLGLYIQPDAPLPPAGTAYPFTVTATAVANPSVTDTANDTFTIPAVPFAHLTAAPPLLFVEPNTAVPATLNLANVGNSSGSFNLVSQTPDGWSVSGLTTPANVAAGSSQSQTVTLNIGSGDLGRTYPVLLQSDTPGQPYTQTTTLNVQIVSPTTMPIFQAAAGCTLDSAPLAASLQTLAQSAATLELGCTEATCQPTDLARTVDAAHMAATYAESAAGPLSSAAALRSAADALAAAPDDTAVLTELTNLATAVTNLSNHLCAVADHRPQARLTPYLTAVQPNTPANFTLELTNLGQLTTTYAITVTGLPTGTAVLQTTIAPNTTANLPISSTPPTTGVFDLLATIVADTSAADVRTSAIARLNVVDRFVQVTAVTADPPFVDTGSSSTTLAATIANDANAPQSLTAQTAVIAPNGSTVHTSSTPINLVVGNQQTFNLGAVNTSGWATGLYTITVTLENNQATFVPDGLGLGYFAVGQSLVAAQAVLPAITAPGAVTVTTILSTEITVDTILPGPNLTNGPTLGPPTGLRPVTTTLQPETAVPQPITPNQTPGQTIVVPTRPETVETSESTDPAPEDDKTNPVPTTDFTEFDGYRRTEQNETSEITYSGAWSNINLGSASGGTHYRADDPGDTAVFTFNGSWVNVGLIGTTTGGNAELFLNGVSQGVIDTYRRETTPFSVVVGGLISATHTLSVTVLGSANPLSSNDYVQLDYIDSWNGTTLPDGSYEQDAIRVFRSTGWGNVNSPIASGGNYYRSTNSTAWFPFTGSSFTYHAIGYNGAGETNLYLDGVYLTTLDLFSYSTITHTLSFTGFTPGPHILQISSYRAQATIDAFSQPGVAPFTDPIAPTTSYTRTEEHHPDWLYNGRTYTQTAQTWSRQDTFSYDKASDGQIIRSQTANDTATLTFHGVWATLGLFGDSTSGSAELFLDGVSQGILDTYRREPEPVTIQFSSLITGPHTITVTVVGDGYVQLDYLDSWDGQPLPDGVTDPQETPLVGHARTIRSDGWDWRTGNYLRANNSALWFPFTGDSVSLNLRADGTERTSRVYVDDQFIGELLPLSYGVLTPTVSFAGFGPGVHLLRLETYRANTSIHTITTPGAPPYYTPPAIADYHRYEEDESAILYNGRPFTETVTTWSRTYNVNSMNASDGQYIASQTANDTITFSFNGEFLSVGFLGDTNGGSATLHLDGAPLGTIDTYRRERLAVNHTFPDIGSGPHTLTITVQGDGLVYFDFIDVWNGVPLPDIQASATNNNGRYFLSDGWDLINNANARDGRYLRGGAHLWFPFSGDSVSYQSFLDGSNGDVRIFIDDQFKGTLALNHATTTTPTYSFDGLGSGTHILRLESYQDNAAVNGLDQPGSPPYQPPPTIAPFMRYEDGHPAMLFNGQPYTTTATTWNRGVGINEWLASDGQYSYSNTTGDTVSLSFTGARVGIGLITGRFGGEVELFIDGVSQGILDTYSRTDDTFSRYYDVSPGSHTISATLTANSHPFADGRRLAVDFIDVWDGTDLPTGTFEDNNSTWLHTSDEWDYITNANFSNGRYRTNGSNLWLFFTGDSITLETVASFSGSRFTELMIDGELQGTINLYAVNPITRTFTFSGFGPGGHVLHLNPLRSGIIGLDNFTTPGSGPAHTFLTPAALHRHEEDSPAMRYNGEDWTQRPNAWYRDNTNFTSENSVAGSSTIGSIFSFTFDGPWANLGYRTRSNGGTAELFLDGISQGIVNFNSPSDANATIQFRDLLTATHTISLQLQSGSIWIDYVDVWDGDPSSDDFQNANLAADNGRLHYAGGLQTYAHPNAIQGDYTAVSLFNAPGHAWYNFVGDSFTFYGLGLNTNSNMDIFIDGVLTETINAEYDFSPTPLAFHYTGLDDGPHTVYVRSASRLRIDGFAANPASLRPYQPTVEWYNNTGAGNGAPLAGTFGIISTIAAGDVNGDGRVELVAAADDTVNWGTLLLFNGDGSDSGDGDPIIWSVIMGAGFTGRANQGMPTIANLDGGIESEIVVASNQGLFAFHHDGTLYWSDNTFTGNLARGNPAIGNLDLDTNPEIVVNLNRTLVVYEHDGALAWSNTFATEAGLPLLADLTGDGLLDIMFVDWANNAYLYDYNLGVPNLVWTTPLSTSTANLFGAPAIADIDGQQPGGDPGPEIAIASFGLLTILDADGSILQEIPLDPGVPGGVSIADVDGDGEVEIVTGMRYDDGIGLGRIYAINADGSLLWHAPAYDSTSANSASVLDLDGDGVYEIAWNGREQGITIFNGSDGSILFNDPTIYSHTATDYPNIVDVDNDGFAEVVIPTLSGIRVLGYDYGWAASRPLWNQHSYHITNINDDLVVPFTEPNSWDVHNTYRTQTPLANPAPSYAIVLTHTAAITDVTVLTNSFNITPTIAAPDYIWDYTQHWYDTVVTRTFQSQIDNLAPGSTRKIAEGTVISYTLNSGQNQLFLPPLYVQAAHLITLEPAEQIGILGGTAVYTITLHNPSASPANYALAVGGLPAEWLAVANNVPMPAGSYVTTPLTVTIPATATQGSQPIWVDVTNGSGGNDSAAAQLTITDGLQITITPDWQAAPTGQLITYTLTLTNLGSLADTFLLTADGLAVLASLPAAVAIPAGSSETVNFYAAAPAAGPHPFTVHASGSSSGADSATAVVEGIGDYGVGVALQPATAVAGSGTPALFNATVTNQGDIVDSYNLAVATPAGWSAELHSNGQPITEITVLPQLLHTAVLSIVVTPPVGTAPGSYPITLTAQSQAAPAVQASVSGVVQVLDAGVSVAFTGGPTTVDPSQPAAWTVQVTNTGGSSDTFDLFATGLFGNVAAISPDSVTLAAGASQQVTVSAADLSFLNPGGATLTVAAQSTNNSAIFAEAQRPLTIAPFSDLAIRWEPASQTITDTFTATYTLVISNTGNVADTFSFAAAVDGRTDLARTELTIPARSAAAVPVQITVSAAGTYPITGTAVTGSGSAQASGSLTVVLTVNAAPTANAGNNQTVDEGELVQFSGSATDPNGDLLEVQWLFGDGATAVSSYSPSHTYADNGDYEVTLIVTDTGNLSANDTVQITVNNVPPTANAGPNQTANQGALVQFQGSFTDPGTADTHTFAWNMGDGVQIFGTLNPSHAYATSGVYTVTLTVTDDDGGVSTDTAVITVEGHTMYFPTIMK